MQRFGGYIALQRTSALHTSESTSPSADCHIHEISTCHGPQSAIISTYTDVSIHHADFPRSVARPALFGFRQLNGLTAKKTTFDRLIVRADADAEVEVSEPAEETETEPVVEAAADEAPKERRRGRGRGRNVTVQLEELSAGTSVKGTVVRASAVTRCAHGLV